MRRYMRVDILGDLNLKNFAVVASRSGAFRILIKQSLMYATGVTSQNVLYVTGASTTWFRYLYTPYSFFFVFI